MAATKKAIKKQGLEQALKKGKFVYTCEVGPPKGAEDKGIRQEVSHLEDVADGINVTDLQSSVMRLGSLIPVSRGSYRVRSGIRSAT